MESKVEKWILKKSYLFGWIYSGKMAKYDKNGSNRYFKIKKWHCEPIIKIMVNVYHINFFLINSAGL